MIIETTSAQLSCSWESCCRGHVELHCRFSRSMLHHIESLNIAHEREAAVLLDFTMMFIERSRSTNMSHLNTSS